MPFPLGHLSRRFFQVIRAKPPTPGEQVTVSRLLEPAEAGLFWAQAPNDQRHAIETMQRLSATVDDPVALRAALLHDVGKADPYLGPFGRVFATVCDALGLRLNGRYLAYRRHGASGAALLEAVGAPGLVVDFARRHPEEDPGGYDPAVWRALLVADEV